MEKIYVWIQFHKVKISSLIIHWWWVNHLVGWLISLSHAQFHANQHSFIENNSKALTKFLNHQYLILYLYNDVNTSTYIPENILKINQGNVCQHLPQFKYKGFFLMNLKENLAMKTNNNWAPPIRRLERWLDDIRSEMMDKDFPQTCEIV